MTRIRLGQTHFDFDTLLDTSTGTSEAMANRVRRYVAGQARDAADARQLLEALGLIDYISAPGRRPHGTR